MVLLNVKASCTLILSIVVVPSLVVVQLTHGWIPKTRSHPFRIGSSRVNHDGSRDGIIRIARSQLPSLFNLAASASTSDESGSSSRSSRFGRQEYWDQLYQQQGNFSWYTGWGDLEPFLQELIPSTLSSIILPGVGNDAMLVDMYKAGYQTITAFDYAPEGIARCQEMLAQQNIPHVVLENNYDNTIKNDQATVVTLFVGDATNLQHQLPNESFDVVLEKGTLDAIVQYSSGAGSSGQDNMELALAELTRILKPQGLFLSVSVICTERLQASPLWQQEATTSATRTTWQVLRDGSLYFTEDGYASNNFDGTLLAWRKEQQQ